MIVGYGKRSVSWNLRSQSDGNSPFPSCLSSLFQSEAKCEAIDMKMIFSHANKTHFHNKGFALGLILKVRVFGTQKWPINRHAFCIGNGMIFSDIWHKYHQWYFEIVIHNLGEWNLRQFWNIVGGIYAKYHVQIMLLFVYTTTCKSFVIFTCWYFKLSWNTTALSQSNCRTFSCSSKRGEALWLVDSIQEGVPPTPHVK